MKFYLNALIWGVLVGGALTSWLAPSVIAWYFDPPVQMGVSCKEATEWAMSRLRVLQMIGAGCGGVAAVALVVLARKRNQAAGGANPPGSGRS